MIERIVIDNFTYVNNPAPPTRERKRDLFRSKTCGHKFMRISKHWDHQGHVEDPDFTIFYE